MNKFRFTINVLAIAIFTLAFASMTQAQATRTWVSGVGDDVNPCSRTAPCKTFAGAISKTATDGEIDALDSGGFGAVTITKSITIYGYSNLAGILAAGTTGVIVNVSTVGVTNAVQLRNLSINGAGTGTNGIRIIGGTNTTVEIENCVIFGFKAGNGRGISEERTVAGKLWVQDTLIKNNLHQGVVVNGVGGVIKATLDNVRLVNNESGVVVSQTNNFIVIRNSVATNNSASGIAADNGARLDIVNCLSSHNGTGINSDSGADVVVSRTTVIRNTTNGLGFSGGTIKSYGNNEVSGNAGGGSSNGPFTAGGAILQ
jgi:hypothetical protein